MTQAVAELSAQTRERGGTPPRGGVHWRYGMGFVVLLASILSLVLVGQIAGWIQDPRGADAAVSAADYRAQLFQETLRTLPRPTAGAVAEAGYAGAVREAGGVLLDVAYPAAGPGPHPGGSPGDGLPTGLTVEFTGRATSGVLSGHRPTVATRCYRFDWSGTAASAARRTVSCPKPGVEPASRTAADPAGSAASLRGLAMRLTALPPALQDVTADDNGVRVLLRTAGLPSGTPWAAGYPLRAGSVARDAVLAVGAGGASGCLFVGLHAGVLTAWTGPLLAPCTVAWAARAVAAG